MAIAYSVIFLQVLLALALLPLGDRWFLHSDDAATYFWTAVVLENGVPSVDYRAQPYADVSAYPVLAGRGATVVGDAMVPAGPFVFFYLLAPFAAFDAPVLFAVQVAIQVCLLAGVYHLTARLVKPSAGIIAVAFFGFSAPSLFWQAFLRANTAGLACLLWGILLVLQPRTLQKCAGTALIILASAIRYELAGFAMILGAVHLPSLLQRPRPREWAWIGAVAAGLIVTILFGVKSIYGTFNVLSIVIDPSGGSSVAGQITKTTSLESLATNLSLFGRFLFPAFLLTGLGVTLGRPWSPAYGALSLGSVGLAGFVLTHEFSPQRYELYYSQMRYLLPCLAAGAIGLGYILTTGKRMILTLLATILLAAAGLVDAENGGFAPTRSFLQNGQSHQAEANALGAGYCYVGDFMGTVVVDHPVIAFNKIPEPQRENETIRIVEKLIRDECRPMLSKHFDFPYYVGIKSDGRFELVDDASSLFYEIRLRNP